MAQPFRAYQVGKYQIFRGKTSSDIWYVYDTEEERYVGGSFDTKASALKWIDKQ